MQLEFVSLGAFSLEYIHYAYSSREDPRSRGPLPGPIIMEINSHIKVFFASNNRVLILRTVKLGPFVLVRSVESFGRGTRGRLGLSGTVFPMLGVKQGIGQLPDLGAGSWLSARS
jgi:hypothetical protein